LLNKCFVTQNVYLFTKNPFEYNNFHTSVACRHNTNEAAKQHYRLYSKILAQVIREAKTMYYNKKIQKSDNKYKAT